MLIFVFSMPFYQHQLGLVNQGLVDFGRFSVINVCQVYVISTELPDFLFSFIFMLNVSLSRKLYVFFMYQLFVQLYKSCTL